MAPATVAVLRNWRTQQEQRLALGLGKAPADGFVFANWDGAVARRINPPRRGARR
jgi:hypothetical protein